MKKFRRYFLAFIIFLAIDAFSVPLIVTLLSTGTGIDSESTIHYFAI